MTRPKAAYGAKRPSCCLLGKCRDLPKLTRHGSARCCQVRRSDARETAPGRELSSSDLATGEQMRLFKSRSEAERPNTWEAIYNNFVPGVI